MSKQIKASALLTSINGLQVGKEGTFLPTNPKLGVLAQNKTDSLIWAMLDGEYLWYPEQQADTVRTYTEAIPVASQSWAITHNLNSDMMVLAIKDQDGKDITSFTGLTPDPTDPANKVIINFSEPVEGRAFFVAADEYIPPPPAKLTGTQFFNYLMDNRPPIFGMCFNDKKLIQSPGKLIPYDVSKLITFPLSYQEEVLFGPAGSELIKLPFDDGLTLNTNNSLAIIARITDNLNSTAETLLTISTDTKQGFEVVLQGRYLRITTQSKTTGDSHIVAVFPLPYQLMDNEPHLIVISHFSYNGNTSAMVFIDGLFLPPNDYNRTHVLGGAINDITVASGTGHSGTGGQVIKTGVSLAALYPISADPDLALYYVKHTGLEPYLVQTGIPDYRWKFRSVPSIWLAPAIGGKYLYVERYSYLTKNSEDGGCWVVEQGVLAESNETLIYGKGDYTIRARVRVVNDADVAGPFSKTIAGQFRGNGYNELCVDMNSRQVDEIFAGHSIGNGGLTGRKGIGFSAQQIYGAEPGIIPIDTLRNNWVTVIVVRKAGEVSVFVDGVAYNQVTLNNYHISGLFSLFGDPKEPEHAFYGFISDMAIWKDRALSRAEIRFATRANMDPYWPDEPVPPEPPLPQGTMLAEYILGNKPPHMLTYYKDNRFYGITRRPAEANNQVFSNETFSWLTESFAGALVPEAILDVTIPRDMRMQTNHSSVFTVVLPENNVANEQVIVSLRSEINNVFTFGIIGQEFFYRISTSSGIKTYKVTIPYEYRDGQPHFVAVTQALGVMSVYIDGAITHGVSITNASAGGLLKWATILNNPYMTDPDKPLLDSALSTYAHFNSTLDRYEISGMFESSGIVPYLEETGIPDYRWRFDSEPVKQYPPTIGGVYLTLNNPSFAELVYNAWEIDGKLLASATEELIAGNTDCTIRFITKPHVDLYAPGPFVRVIAGQYSADGTNELSVDCNCRSEYLTYYGLSLGNGGVNGRNGLGLGTKLVYGKDVGGPHVHTAEDWVNVVVVKKGNAVSMFINGVAHNHTTIPSVDIAGLFTMFGDPKDPSTWFKGTIRELAIWKDRALSRAEIRFANRDDMTPYWPDNVPPPPPPLPPEPEPPVEEPGSLFSKVVELNAKTVAYVKPSTKAFIDSRQMAIGSALNGYAVNEYTVGRSIESFATGIAGQRMVVPASANNSFGKGESFAFYAVLPSRFEQTAKVIASTLTTNSGWELSYSWCTVFDQMMKTPMPAIKFSYYAQPSGGGANVLRSVELKLTNPLTDGMRHLVCITLSNDSSAVAKLYVDGIDITTSALSGILNLVSNSSAISLLNSSSGADKPLIGNGLSLFSMFNFVLSQEQVTALQNSVEKTPKADLPKLPLTRWVFNKPVSEWYDNEALDIPLNFIGHANIERVENSAGKRDGAFRMNDNAFAIATGTILCAPAKNWAIHMRVKFSDVGYMVRRYSAALISQVGSNDIGTIVAGVQNLHGLSTAGVELSNGSEWDRIGVGHGDSMTTQNTALGVVIDEWCDLVFVRRDNQIEVYHNGKIAHIETSPAPPGLQPVNTVFFASRLLNLAGEPTDTIAAGVTNGFSGDVQEINYWGGAATPTRAAIQELTRNDYSDVWKYTPNP